MIASGKFDLPVPSAGDIFDSYATLQGMAAGRTGAASGHAAWLGGWLLAVFGLDAAGIAALVAGAVAGAVVLAVDDQRSRVKELLRHGICDFVVNDLDEAQRILKNEVRKRQPASVCLPAAPEVIAVEMVERGLQPELLAGSHPAAANPLLERGAVWLQNQKQNGPLLTWRLKNEAAAWAAGPVLARVDELAAAALDEDDAATPSRIQWLRRAPRYMGRRLAVERCVRMNEAEADRLLRTIRGDATLAAKLSLRRDGASAEI